MSVIHEHLSSLLLLALPSGLLGATQDTQFSTSKPSQARSQTVSRAPPPRPRSESTPGDLLQSLSSRSSTLPKRVSWADEYSNDRFETSMRRSPTRLQGFAASQQTARAHVQRARMTTASHRSVLHTSKPELGAKPLTNDVKGWHAAWHMLGKDHEPSDGSASTTLIMF